MHGMEYGSATSVPAFLAKLWTLVEDGSTDDIIAWDQSGSSFHIFDQSRLAKEVLPIYFKHNNMASFVRQLNMYGFRKIMQVDHGGMKIESGDMEFAHPFFQKDRDHLLDKIKRKVSHSMPARTEESNLGKNDIHRLLTDVHTLKTKTDEVTSQLDGVKRENEALWREVAILRQKHHKQQTVLNKLVQFLVTVVGPRGMPPVKRKLIPIMSGGGQIPQDQGPSRPAKVQRQYHTSVPETARPYKVQQPRTPPSKGRKGVTIQEVFDDPPEYVDVGDMVFPQTESPAGASSMSSPSSGGGGVKVEDILDDPTIMENVAQGIRRFSAETTGQQPVTVNMSSQGKQMKDTKFSRRKTGNPLKVKLPPSATMVTSQQVVTLPDNNTAQQSTANQKAMARPGTGGTVSNVGDNLETIEFDLESIKDLLSEGYNLDPNTLLGLFNPEGPVPSTPEHLLNLEENPLKLPETGDIVGNELIQYNPPEDLSTIFDLQDIAPVTDADDDLTGQGVIGDLHTPLVTPLDGIAPVTDADGDLAGQRVIGELHNPLGNLLDGSDFSSLLSSMNKDSYPSKQGAGINIKQEMEDVD